MGAGFYGVPLELCAGVMYDITTEFLEGDTKIEKVIICLNDAREYKSFHKSLGTLRDRIGVTK
jgi:O-acetyl-ADP-ribose deacetylase (regulator of RNase III)